MLKRRKDKNNISKEYWNLLALIMLTLKSLILLIRRKVKNDPFANGKIKLIKMLKLFKTKLKCEKFIIIVY